MLPSQYSQGTNYTSTRQYCQIVKFKFTLWTAQMSHCIKNFWAVLCLRSAEISAQKLKLPWSLLPPSPPPPTHPRLLSPLLFFYLMALWSLRGVLSKFKLPSKSNFNILRANSKVLSSQVIFSLHPFLWMMWIWSQLNGMKVHPWKFMKDEIHSKNITYDLISSMKYSSFRFFLFV
jgi:hypothetical protein